MKEYLENAIILFILILICLCIGGCRTIKDLAEYRGKIADDCYSCNPDRKIVICGRH